MASTSQSSHPLLSQNLVDTGKFFCPFLERGFCRESSRCNFSHSRDSTRIPTNYCHFYLANQCLYGLECKFKHSEPSTSTSTSQATSSRPSTSYLKFDDASSSSSSGTASSHLTATSLPHENSHILVNKQAKQTTHTHSDPINQSPELCKTQNEPTNVADKSTRRQQRWPPLAWGTYDGDRRSRSTPNLHTSDADAGEWAAAFTASRMSINRGINQRCASVNNNVSDYMFELLDSYYLQPWDPPGAEMISAIQEACDDVFGVRSNDNESHHTSSTDEPLRSKHLLRHGPRVQQEQADVDASSSSRLNDETRDCLEGMFRLSMRAQTATTSEISNGNPSIDSEGKSKLNIINNNNNNSKSSMSYAKICRGKAELADAVECAKQELQLCPISVSTGVCPYPVGQCSYLHGLYCDLCGRQCLHPHNQEQQRQHRDECLREHEREMELSFAIQRSKDKVCGICMDTVVDKKPITSSRFGILEKCNHIFCIDCIRKWRGTKQFETRTIRACPECRVSSDFVVPSKYWIEDQDDKDKLIHDYKEALRAKPCKYFDEGRGECPFAGSCFYKHAYPDGRLAEMGTPKPRRRVHGFRDDSLVDYILWNITLGQEPSLIDDIYDIYDYEYESEDDDIYEI